MKPMGEMIRAVRDWVNSKVDPDTILRKTGDASKVTNMFSMAGSRVLPASGENLDVTLGKILQYLSDLKTVAFSGLYKDLSYKSIQMVKHVVNYSRNVAYTEDIITSDGKIDGYIQSKLMGMQKMWLVVGIGGSESTAGVSGATDFARAYLIVTKLESSSVNDCKGRSFILLQLGSSGSTARYTLTAVAATGVNDEKVTLTIPKGSYAHVKMYELNCAMEYVG